MNIVAEMTRFVAPIRRRLSLVVGRGILSALDETKALQVLKVITGPDEALDSIEHIQNYGFTSVPEAGGEVVLVCVGGNRGQAIAIAADDSRARKKDLAPGDVAVYRKGGDYILLNADGIKIHSSGKVVVDAGTVELSNAGTLKALMTEDLVGIFNAHVHATVTSLGVPTQPAVLIPPATAVTLKTKAG